MSEIIEINPEVDKVEPVINKPKETIGKTFSEDYVQSLREEAKNNRLAKKAVEAKIKALLGLTEEDDISDDKITNYKATQEKLIADALSKANERLITAEIKAQDGYDTKLAMRLIDKSKLKVTDDGQVEGIKEQLEELVKEFPALKVTGKQSGANPPHETKTERDKLIEQYNVAEQKKDWPRVFALEQQIKALKK